MIIGCKIGFYLAVIFACAKPLGWYMACVYQGQLPKYMQFLTPLEVGIYRICGINPQQEMTWRQYTLALLLLNGLGLLAVFVIQRLQFYMPGNPQHLFAPQVLLAFNTAVSYVTNTNWQAYSGESTLSYGTQMLALTSQNFLSAATGMVVLVALIRGLYRTSASYLGNYWVDMVRTVLYILLPLACLLTIVLVSQGVIQNLKPNLSIQGLQAPNQQIIPMGPVASQVAIKQLGSNGGGFFNANSAHPFENPTPFSNFLEMLAILLIPAALTYTFGTMVQDKKQGWVILGVMLILFLPAVGSEIWVEHQPNPILQSLVLQGENLEGKETRFGVVDSAIWTVATTASSNGSVNSMLDSYAPLGGLIPLWMINLNEVVFGGVGSGLYGMLLMVMITVFIGGLMIGRTPEYLGKKITPFEMKMAVLALLLTPVSIVLACAVAFLIGPPQAVSNPGAHGLTEILYALSSMANNNGSAFSGLQSDHPFYLNMASILMLIGRYGVIIPVLALGGALVTKQKVPVTGEGMLATHTPVFMLLLIAVILLLGALAFLPLLALGPIVEHLQWGLNVF